MINETKKRLICLDSSQVFPRNPDQDEGRDGGSNPRTALSLGAPRLNSWGCGFSGVMDKVLASGLEGQLQPGRGDECQTDPLDTIHVGHYMMDESRPIIKKFPTCTVSIILVGEE